MWTHFVLFIVNQNVILFTIKAESVNNDLTNWSHLEVHYTDALKFGLNAKPNGFKLWNFFLFSRNFIGLWIG